HALHRSGELPAPPDLPRRVLGRPPFTPRRSARAGRRTGPPVRRTWAVAGAAASVAAVVLGMAVFGGTAGPNGTIDGSAGSAPPAATSAAGASGAATTPGATTTSPTTPVLLPRGEYQAWSTQTVPCAGVAPVNDAEQQLLRPGVAAASVVVCDTAEKERAGDGVWLMAGERELTAAQTTALTAALTVADVPVDPAGVCDAMAVVVPDFALILEDGRTVRPGVPGDGCHPSRDVASILAPPTDPGARATTPVEQLRSQAMVDAGCDPASTPYADPFSSGGTGSTGSRPKPPAAASVCRYSVTGDSPQTRSADLASLGSPGRKELAAALDPLLDAQVKPAPACTAAEAAFAPADTGWLTVVTPVAGEGKATSEVVL